MTAISKKFMSGGDNDNELPLLCRGRGGSQEEVTFRHREAPSDSPSKRDLCQVLGTQVLPGPSEQLPLPAPPSPEQQAHSALPLQAPGKVYTPSVS